MGKSTISLSFISVLIILSVLWKPALSDAKCSTGCTGSQSGQSFLNGQKYNYAVDGTVTIFLTGAAQQETSLKLLGQASVSALGNCAYVLKIQDMAITGPDGRKYGKPPGLEKPVRFTLENGKAGPELCSEDGDTRRSLNIKRAIISLLQTEQKSSTETDFFGICPTEISSSQEGAALLLHKRRDLSLCGHREQGKNGLMNAVFNPTAEIKETSVLRSTLNVESKVNGGVPEKISANEEYLYRPFSVGENGARAKVHTKLTLTGKTGGALNGHFTETHTIIFENPHGTDDHQSSAQFALMSVRDTAKSLQNVASEKSAGLFAELIRTLRFTKKQDLFNVYSQVKGNTLERRVFLDALFRAGTGHSLEIIIEILKKNEFQDLEQPLAYLSLGNARHVDDDALKAAATLLDMQSTPKELFLGVGALAGAYCRDHYCHDGKASGVVAVSQKFAAKLPNCRTKDKLEEDRVIAILKGVRNIRHLENNLIDKLAQCANDNNAKARVRVAALEAFQADPCNNKLKSTGLDIMKNRQLDSEIRIKAYLSVISCPCAKSATEIKNLLDTEPVQQVGRFITTSLRHIRTSANPDKALARQHYGLIHTPNRFKIDDRKYSFYREASYNIDTLGLGGTLEQTVIYSQDSFLPRSASFNLTAEIFGHSLNVLEMGGRQGNLDRVAEHFFGPKGLLRTEDPQSLYDNIMRRYEETMNKLHNFRRKRSVQTEVDSFDRRVKAEATPYNNELDLDIYIKLFGTDALFLSLGDDKGFDFNRALDHFMQVLGRGMDEVKHFQHEIRTHLLFLDAELAYPTSTGLPLKLDLVGSATARFELATNIDVRQILNNPNNAKIDIKLMPSTDIEIAGIFLVDADIVSTGLKVTTNLHSSTGGHLVAKVLEQGRGIDLQLALPLEKQEIVTASSDLVYVTRVKGQKEKQTALRINTPSKEYSGCFDQLANVVGLTLCAEVSLPFSFSRSESQAYRDVSNFVTRFPLTGPAKLKLVLEKQDLRGYHIKGIVRNDEHKGSFELLFEAEGSRTIRTLLTGELVNEPAEKTVKLAIESPFLVSSGQISLYAKHNEYAALVQLKNGSTELYGKLGFNVQGNERRSVYKPVLEFKYPGRDDVQRIDIDGQLVVEKNGPETKYTFGGKFQLPQNEDMLEVNGHAKCNPSSVELDMNAKMRNQEILSLSASKKDHDYKIAFTNSFNPNVNFKLDGHFENGPETNHNDFEISYGDNFNNQHNRIIYNQLLKYHNEHPEQFSFITKNKFEIRALPFKLEFDADFDPKKLDVKLEGIYTDRKVEFDLESRRQIRHPGDYRVKFEVKLDKKGVEALFKRDIVSQEKTNYENTVEIKNIGKYELSGVVTNKQKPNDNNVGFIGHFKIQSFGSNGRTEDFRFDIGLVDNGHYYSTHAKVGATRGDILDYLFKVTYGGSPTGQLKFTLKDTIEANGQFTITSDSQGRGTGLLIVDFKKSQRKFKVDLKCQINDPIFNADVDLFLNYEKDNNDKLHFSTQTKSSDHLFESKNVVEYAGKKGELNLHKDGTLALGKTHASAELVLPTERCFTLNMDRDMNVHDDVYNGNYNMLFSDAAKRGAAASTIGYKFKLTNTNFDKEELDYEGQFEMKLNNGRNLQNTFFLKNVPNGPMSKFDFKSDVTGNLIPQPASFSANCEYTNALEVDGSGNYKFKGNYGREYSFEYNGVSDVKIVGEGGKKYQDDNELTLRLPFEDAHDIKLTSNMLYVQADSENINYEYNLVEGVQINGEVYKLEANGKSDNGNGNSKIKVAVPRVDPVSLDITYAFTLQGDRKTGNVEIKSIYGKNTSPLVTAAEITTAPQEVAANLKLITPRAIQNIGQKFVLNAHFKNPAPNIYLLPAMLAIDDKQAFVTDSQISLSTTQPLLDISYQAQPSQRPSKVYFKGELQNTSNRKLDFKLENVNGISLNTAMEANEERDNLNMKFNGDSEKLGMKNFKMELSSKDAGNGKRLEIHVTNDNQNILSGSTSYITKEEGPKTIIEGSGSVRVREEQKSVNFKYIRTLLTEGNEQGIETFFNMAVGERSYVTEYRSTNLEYKYSYVYCEEKKQCAHAEINSKVNLQGPGVAQHVLNVGFDLRKLGISPEFGLQVSNEVSDHRLPQYSLDLHVNNQDKKYHMHVYSQPEFGKFPSGITITLPQRVLALEGLVTYPKDKSMPFPVQGELVLHLDKNKPQMKTAGRFLLDVQETNDVYAILAEAGFSHPRLGREAVARYRQVLERKEANTYKIESAGTISFPPFGSDLNTKLTLEASPTKLKLLVETPVIRIISLESSAILRDNLQQGEVTFSLLQGKPVHILALARDYTYYEFTTGYTDEQERKLSIIGHLQPESRVDISADIFLPGQKKNIAHGAVFLQENTVKSEYGVSKDNFNYFLNALKSDVDNLEARIKQAGEKASNDFKNSLKRAEPTFKQMQQSYEEELTKLYREIENDQTLKEFSKTISDVYSYLAAIIVDIIEHTKPLVDTVIDIVTETSKAIQKMFEERLEPQIKELYNTIAAGVKETLNGLLDLVASFTALFTDFFERHRAELEELTNTIGDIFIDLTRLVVAQLKEFYTSLLQTLTDLQVQIQNLPIFNIIQEKWKDLAVPDQVVALLQEAQNTARNLMPNDETRAFSDALFNYIQKKLRQERMDEGAELRNLWEKFTEAQVSLIQFARLHFSQLGVLYPFDWSSIPFWFSPSGSLPSLGNAPRFSILEQIMKGEFPEAFEVIKAYRPRSLNPFDEVPSKLRAVIVNGQHIFTFDGRHMTFPGNCRYVLAHDFADRNFTLVMQLQNGQPKSLILEDKSGSTVELKDNKQAALNGAVHPFPIIEKDTFAFKTANERVGLGSLYGVMAFCSQQLEVCYIEVSGYYSGKLRGLLGDGNNEAYDDLRMPNGRVVTSESEFGNAYRLVTSCPQVRTPEHSVHQHHSTLPAACEQVFGGNSPLRPLSLLLDIAPFRQACIHAVSASSADALKEACDLGRGYAALALTGLLPAVLPRACLRCTDTDTPKEIGDTYTYTLPARQADIVVTFETTKQSEDAYRKLLVPLVAQLVSGLKSKHVDDIRVYLVGITPKYPYPIVYDTDLRIGNAKVQFDDESRYTNIPRVYERNADVTFRQYQDRFYNLIDNILIKLGLTNVVASYESTLQLPLRPGAVKHSINLVGEQCRDQFFLLEALRNFAYEIMFSHNGYKHTLIAPTPNLQIGNGKVPAQVVGFSEKAVIMLGDRKVGKDAEALRPTLEVQSDSCIDFVENTDGLTLSSTNFEALNAAQQKQYLQTASHAILHELLDYNLTQECVCAYADPLRAQSICVTKERREITRRRK